MQHLIPHHVSVFSVEFVSSLIVSWSQLHPESLSLMDFLRQRTRKQMKFNASDKSFHHLHSDMNGNVLRTWSYSLEQLILSAQGICHVLSSWNVDYYFREPSLGCKTTRESLRASRHVESSRSSCLLITFDIMMCTSQWLCRQLGSQINTVFQRRTSLYYDSIYC